MVDSSHGDFPRPSSELIARSLLESAKQDPALLGRVRPPIRTNLPITEGEPVEGWELTMRPDGPQPIQLPGTARLDLDRQLEDLVSIAVESAHQAEDAVQQARDITSTARRGMAVFAGFGAAGILMGLAAILDNHLHLAPSPTMARTEVASAVPSLGEPGQVDRSAVSQPLAQATQPDSATPAEPAVETPPPQATGTSGLLIPAASAQPAARVIAPPVNHGPRTGYATAWPGNRRVMYSEGRRVVMPPFFFALRRDFSALLRAFPPHS
jgi:hypothetical protein